MRKSLVAGVLAVVLALVPAGASAGGKGPKNNKKVGCQHHCGGGNSQSQQQQQQQEQCQAIVLGCNSEPLIVIDLS